MKNLLFDFDGTLVDSMPTYVRSIFRILDDNGVSYGPEVVREVTPLGVSKTAEYFIAMGLKMEKMQILATMAEHMMDAYCHSIPAKEGVIEALERLHQNGYRLFVLTASPHISLDPCLKRLGIWELFEKVWSCDDFGTTKSNPEIYRLAAEQMGVTVGEVLFLDDNILSCSTAKEAGMKTCGVFDESSADEKEAIRARTDYYIDSFSELWPLLKGESV